MCRNLLPNFVENAQFHDRHFYNLVFAKILKIGKLNLLKEWHYKKTLKSRKMHRKIHVILCFLHFKNHRTVNLIYF